VLKLSRAVYYDSRTRAPSARAQTDATLSVTSAEVHARSRGTYRAPRVHADRRLGLGVRCSRKRVARLMAAAGLVWVSHRRERPGSRPLPATHADLVQRRFITNGPTGCGVPNIPRGRERCTAPR
jgi:putative transposase